MTINLTTTETKLIATAAACADRAIRWPDTLKGQPRNEIIKRLLAAGYAVIANGCVTITDAAAAATGASAHDADRAEYEAKLRRDAQRREARRAAEEMMRAAEARRRAQEADAAFRAARDRRAAEQKIFEEAAREREARRTPKAPRPGSKIEQMIWLMMRVEGATIDEIAQHCGWQRHTVRGAMAGKLRQMGYTIEKRGAAGRPTAYHIKPL